MREDHGLLSSVLGLGGLTMTVPEFGFGLGNEGLVGRYSDSLGSASISPVLKPSSGTGLGGDSRVGGFWASEEVEWVGLLRLGSSTTTALLGMAQETSKQAMTARDVERSNIETAGERMLGKAGMNEHGETMRVAAADAREKSQDLVLV